MDESTPTSKKIFCVYYNTDPNAPGDSSENLSATGSSGQMRQPRMSSKLRDARIKWQNLRSGSVSTEGRNGDATQNTLHGSSSRGNLASEPKTGAPAVKPLSSQIGKPSLNFVSDRSIRTSAPEIISKAGLTTKARSNQQAEGRAKPKKELYQVFSQWEENQDSISDRNINPRTYIYDQNTMYIKKAGTSGPNPVLPILSQIEENLTEADDNLNFLLERLGVRQPAAAGKSPMPSSYKSDRRGLMGTPGGRVPHLQTVSRDPSLSKQKTGNSPSSAQLQKALSMNIYCDYDPGENPYGSHPFGNGSLVQSPQSQNSPYRPSLVTKALLTQTNKRDGSYATLF